MPKKKSEALKCFNLVAFCSGKLRLFEIIIEKGYQTNQNKLLSKTEFNLHEFGPWCMQIALHMTKCDEICLSHWI